MFSGDYKFWVWNENNRKLSVYEYFLMWYVMYDEFLWGGENKFKISKYEDCEFECNCFFLNFEIKFKVFVILCIVLVYICYNFLFLWFG